jgi:hypothetical protein
VTRLALAIVVLLVPPVASEGQDLDAIVRQAAARRREYVEAFKSLTATETRVAERLDRNGALERKRTVVSDFLGYQSEIKTGEVNEYRIVREVDGKPVGDASASIRTFQRLAGSKTQQQEFERLRDVNAKYSLGYATCGSTINQLGAAETWRAHRSEFEMVAVAEGITTPLVLMRYDVDYSPSAFDVLTPRKIVVSFFDRSEKKTPQIRWLNARIMYTYDAFKRFDVSTSTDIQLPQPR